VGDLSSSQWFVTPSVAGCTSMLPSCVHDFRRWPFIATEMVQSQGFRLWHQPDSCICQGCVGKCDGFFCSTC
jgi:hypothetical protein